MPCYDAGPTAQQRDDERRVPPMLCALASVLERHGQLNDWLDRVDWSEAGMTRAWFDRWWKEHKVDDARRRREETGRLAKGP